MKKELASLLKTAKDGDFDEEIQKVKVLGLPGLTWVKRSEFKKTEKEIKKAIVQAKKKGGENRPGMALMEYFLGDLYMRHGRPGSAEKHLLKAMKIWADTDADNFRGSIHKLLDLAEQLAAAGNLDTAESLGLTIVNAVTANLGEGDFLIVSALSDLAVACRLQGKTSDAEDLLSKALCQAEKNADTLSRFGPRILMNLAGVSTFKREFAEAELHLNRALEIAEAAAEKDEGHILEIVCNKAKVYAALGKGSELESATEMAETAYEAVWETDPGLAISCMFDLVRLHEGLGLNETGEKIFSRLAQDAAALIESGDEEKFKIVVKAWFRDIGEKGPTRMIREGIGKDTAYLLAHSEELRKEVASLGSGREDTSVTGDRARKRN